MSKSSRGTVLRSRVVAIIRYPFSLKSADCFRSIVSFASVFCKVQPFTGTHYYIRINMVFISVFNDMNILYPEAFTGSQNCTCILRLIYIFQNNRNISGPVIQAPGQTIPSAFLVIKPERCSISFPAALSSMQVIKKKEHYCAPSNFN